MGLDITACSKRKAVAKDDGYHVYVNPEFPAQADGLQDGTYIGDQELEFKAGSYIGYGHWREQLAKLAGYEKVRVGGEDFRRDDMLHAAACWHGATGPFSELINFSDCEGVIGPVTAAKLAKDFAEFAGVAAAHEDRWFYDRYQHWRKAFELARPCLRMSYSHIG